MLAMSKRCRAALLSLFLALAVPTAGQAAEGVSQAEKQMFELPHLANLPAAATLHYGYRKSETGQAVVTDEAVLNARSESERGRVVKVDYLHGERHLDLPEVDQAASNPVILYFLESDVRDLRKRLGGQENYFRRRIRLALAETANTQPVDFTYGGKTVHGTRVEVKPFADDPLKDRFKGFAGKAYRFTLSPDVPGGVYELRTVVDDPAAAGQPKFEEVLTLRAEKSAGQ